MGTLNKVIGIKSVDFKIQAFGYGVVNWNGATELNSFYENQWQKVKTHSLPKLRGYINKKHAKNSETGELFETLKNADEIDFKQTPLYISQNCIRHHLFREQILDLHHTKTVDDVKQLLPSMVGLMRGYVVTIKGSPVQPKRTSSLLLEDFVDILGNGNFEQFSRVITNDVKDGGRDKTSYFSKTTFGDTEYTAYGSINIEQLQFISLSPDFDRCAIPADKNDAPAIAQQVQGFIQSLDPTREPKVTFHENYVRRGTIYNYGEAGLLLDDVAIDILVQKTLQMIGDLSIRQAKGYMYVDSVDVDYNDSNKMMRIKRSPEEINSLKQGQYAVYFDAK